MNYLGAGRKPRCLITVAISQWSVLCLILPSWHSMTETTGTLVNLFEAGIPGMSPFCVPAAIHSMAARFPEINEDVRVKCRSGKALNQP